MKRKTHLIFYFIVVFSAAGSDSALAKLPKHELTSVEDCNLLKEEYEAVPIQHAVRIVEVKNKKTLEMNLTVAKKTLPLLTTIRVYKLVKNKKIPDHMVSNLSCNNPVISIVWKRLRLKHDRDCCMLPGVMVTKLPDINFLLHNPREIGTLSAGTHIYDVQMHTKRGVMMCLSWRIEGSDH